MSSPIGRAVTGLLSSFPGTKLVEGLFIVPTSATALPVGGMTQPGACWMWNADPTNFITVFNGSTGAPVIQLYGGGLAASLAVFTWPPGAVPYVKADTASCQLEYVISGQ